MSETVFDQAIAAIKEKKFDKDQVIELVIELWETYPDWFQKAGFVPIPEPDY